MKQFSAKAKGAIVLAAAGALTAALLVEPINCSRRDDMQSFGSKNIKEEKALTQKEALEKIQSGKSATQVSWEVFGFLKGSAPKQEKYAVVEAFCAKFKDKALLEFSRYAHVDFGFEFDGGLEQFAKNDPAKLSYMQALTHGLFSFGDVGLRMMVSVVSMQPDPSPFSILRDRESPLTTQIAYMVCAKLKKYDKMDANGAIEYIKSYLFKENVTETAKKSLLGMIEAIDPSALDSIKNDPKMPSGLKDLANELRKTSE